MSDESMMVPAYRNSCVVDVEMTGFGRHDRMVEIAAVTLDPVTETIDEFDTLIHPGRDVAPTGVHSISAAMLKAAPTLSDIVPALAGRLQGTVLIAQNLVFDPMRLRQEFDNRGIHNDLRDGLCRYRATTQRLYSACDASTFHCLNSIAPWPTDRPRRNLRAPPISHHQRRRHPQ